MISVTYNKKWFAFFGFMATFVVSELLRAQALPIEFKMSLFVRVPKVAADVTKGLEVVSTSAPVNVQIYLLAKDSADTNKLCVLAEQTSSVQIVSGSLNLTFAKGVGVQPVSCPSSYCSIGEGNFSIVSAIPGNNAQEKLLRALYSPPLNLSGIKAFTAGALDNEPSSLETCNITSMERYLGLKFQAKNSSGATFPLNFKIQLGAAPYAGIAASVVPGSIGAEALADGVVTDDKIATVSANKLTGTLDWTQLPAPLNSTSSSCDNGKVLKRVSNAWACADDLGMVSESDPSVQIFAKNVPGQGLEVVSDQVKLHINSNHFEFGTDGALNLKNNAIDTAQIKTGAVSDDKIVSVSATKIVGVLPVSNGGTGSGTALNNNRVMISSGDKIVESNVTADKLGYLAGVTSGVQEQLNSMAHLAGRSGGQSLHGGTAASENLILDSTSNATKGNVLINPTGGRIGIGTTTPAASAVLDISSTTGGVLLPRLTTAQRNAISSPATGLQIYNTDTNELQYYNGSGWQALSVAGSGLQQLNGLSAANQTFAIGTSGLSPFWSSAGSTHTLNIPLASAAGVTGGLISKTDYDNFNNKLSATVTSPTSGQVIRYDGSAWVNATLTSNDIPDLDAGKITTGVLPVSRGGTGSGTALNNNRVMISSGGKIIESAAISSNRALASDANGLPVASSVTATELGYLSGVTSPIQTQFNAIQTQKANQGGWTNFSVLTTNGSGQLQATAGSVNGSVLQYSVTGPVFSQASYPSTTNKNGLLYSSANNVVSELASSNNAVLTTNGFGTPNWSPLSNDLFSQYALLAGRSGGQSLHGGTGNNENLILDSTSATSKGNVLINPSGGNVGIGYTNPDSRLSVKGTVSTPVNVIPSGGSVDLALSSIHLLQNVGGSTISLSNLANGGVYTIIVSDTTSRTYTFSGCNFTYFSPSNGATESGTHTVYGITTVVISSQWYCYISWLSGYQ